MKITTAVNDINCVCSEIWSCPQLVLTVMSECFVNQESVCFRLQATDAVNECRKMLDILLFGNILNLLISKKVRGKRSQNAEF